MNIISTVNDFINTTQKKINKLARKTGFKIRKGKIKPETFALTMTIGLTELHEVTLDTLAGKCEEIQKGLCITKQALEQRMKVGSVLMESIFAETLTEISKKYEYIEYIDALRQFKDTRITDGTTISLSNKLEKVYTGLGGNNANSAIKIQATYSIHKREFTGLDFFSATKNDATYNEETLRTVEAGDLIIKDLGYYDGDYFRKIDEKQAFFISRIKTNCVLYEIKNNKYETIDTVKMLKKSKFDLDKRLFIKLSSGEMHEIRIVGIKLPQEISAQKKRKAYKAAKNKGKQLTTKEIQLLDWLLVITNVSEDMLSIRTICELYRLRWQIELLFKALKSSMDFEKFGNTGEYYFKCLFYGKLVMLLLTMRMFAICKLTKFNKSGRLVSIQKFVRNFRNSLKFLVNAILNPTKQILNNLEQHILRIADRSFFDKRTRKTTEECLMTHDLPVDVIITSIAVNL